MPTTQQIIADLNTAASANNMSLITTTINSITTAQKSEISPTTYMVVLDSIARYTFVNDATANSTVRNFMSKVGTFVPATAIGEAMVLFANDKNFGGLDAVTDYLTSSQKSQLSPTQLMDTLVSVARNTFEGPDTTTNAATATAVRDFMVKLGGYVPAPAIGQAMTILAQDYNFSALDAVTDYLTASQKSQIAPWDLHQTLLTVAMHTAEGPDTTTNVATANAIRDLVSKLGAFIPTDAIGEAMTILAQDYNFSALDAVTDYLTTSQKSQLAPWDLHQTLLTVAMYTAEGPDTTTNSATANAIRDLVSKLGAFIPANAIGEAMTILARDYNFVALDAVTDYLTAGIKSQLSPWSIHETLVTVAQYTAEGPGTGTDLVTANVLRDLMSKLSGYVPVSTIIDVVEVLTIDQNFGGLSAVFDNITDSALAEVNIQMQADFTAAGIKALLSGNDTYTAGSGHDVIFARNGNDTVNSGSGNDKVYGGNGADIIRGGAGNDQLRGEEGNDTLYGDAGNDILWGDGGYNVLSGGLGADTFIFSAQVDATDMVLDFKVSEGDRLDFSSLLDGFDPLTHAITDFVTKQVSGGDTTVFIDADGKGSGAAVAVAILDNVDVNIQTLYNSGQIIA